MTGRRGVKGRDGFTLVELMISAVVGTLVLTAIYQMLILNQRSFTIQSEQIRQRQTLRATLDVLTSHLSEVSGAGGDILAGGADSITFRSLKGFGIVCAATPTGLRIERHGTHITSGDSVMLLAENGISDPLDDQWLLLRAGSTDTTSVCPTGQRAYDVELAGVSLGPSVRVGAPIRAFETRTFRLGPLGSQWFLTRTGAGGPAEPLVGPLAAPANEGLRFDFLDSLNVTVADPRAADQIVVTVRTDSQVLGVDRIPLVDSASARLSLKN